jgi:hypothetical protein
MRARVEHLEAQGLLARGRREEEVVVIRGRAAVARPAAARFGAREAAVA